MTLLSTHPANPSPDQVVLAPGDALLIVDLQNDFLPGGALGIAGGGVLLPVLRRYCDCFVRCRLPIVFSRDWHPPRHCSFREQGGPWPVHCVADTPGSLAPKQFQIPSTVEMIYKATTPDKDVYSAFEDTPLHELLQRNHVRRLFIGGLATDYCVIYSVRDARRLGYEVCLLLDGIAAVNRQPGDSERAVNEMVRIGAIPVRLERLAQ